jgi:hypothetical protein
MPFRGWRFESALRHDMGPAVLSPSSLVAVFLSCIESSPSGHPFAGAKHPPRRRARVPVRGERSEVGATVAPQRVYLDNGVGAAASDFFKLG